MPELILYNGRLFTQDPDFPRATAVAISRGRFLVVGGDDEVRSLAGPRTQVVNLEGRRVLPGMTDAHFHYHTWALSLRRLALAGVPSLPELQAQVAQFASAAHPGAWLLGQGWNETEWAEPRVPTRADLDPFTGDHPAILWRADLHLAVANSRALEAAGITAETADPPQGIIDRDDEGRPTGVLRELAINLVRQVIPLPPEDEVMDAMRAGFPLLHELGITGVHDFRIMGGADGPPAFHAYHRLQQAGELDLRLWMNLPGERLDEAIALGLRTGFGGERLRVGHLKLFSDGSQGARTAWMLEPYDDTGTCGMPLTPMAEIADAMRRAHRAGLSVAIHAIGDRANRELVDALERVQAQEDPTAAAPPAVPHRIEHVQMIRPEDVERMGRLGLVASVQPIHVADDIPMIERSVGERARFAYPFQDLRRAGAILAFGSDSPVADPNPMPGIHAAVTRRRRDGSPPGGWYPQQRLTVAQAVEGFTLGPARASGREAELGSITPGKWADLAVLDRNIFDVELAAIRDTRVVLTIFDGRIVHREV
jgi:hypothetical protein